MHRLHVGGGTTRGALTIFPVWSEYTGPRRYTSRHDHIRVAEQLDGPDVGTLTVGNLADRPLLMFEGQIVEGGWQNRMLTHSVLLPAHAELAVDVVCVEAGRWEGGRIHRSGGRRGSSRVRSSRLVEDGSRQQEVWRRVSEYDDRLGANTTDSFTEHADRADAQVRRLTSALRPLTGQVGVLIALAGQPIVAEVFDSPMTLAREFRPLVRAAAMDALWLPPIPTPSRRARRFIDRAAQVERRVAGDAGLGTTLTGRSEYADVVALEWERHDVHAVLTNPRHQLVAA